MLDIVGTSPRLVLASMSNGREPDIVTLAS